MAKTPPLERVAALAHKSPPMQQMGLAVTTRGDYERSIGNSRDKDIQLGSSKPMAKGRAMRGKR